MKARAKELKEAKKFIIKTFGELYANGGETIRDDVFFEKAKAAGIYNGGCGEPISEALYELAKVEFVNTPDGKFVCRLFRLKKI